MKIFGIIITGFFLLAVWLRVEHTYLEDDVLWFFPVVVRLAQGSSVLHFLNCVHTPASELTFFDSVYFLFAKGLFGYQLWRLTCVSLAVHLINALLIWGILEKIYRRRRVAAISAGLIYLSYYGHFHAYLWPMAMHHLITVFFILLFIYLFEIIEQRIVNGQSVGWFYWGAMIVLSVMASALRLSMLIIPIVIIGRIIFGARSITEARQQYRRWVFILGVLFFYQTVRVLTGSCGSVLSGFLGPFVIFRLGWSDSIIIAAIMILSGSWMIDRLLSCKISMALPAWVSLGSSALVSLLLFNWVFAYPLAMGCDTVGRWQMVPAVQPMWMRWVLWGATSCMLIGFVRFCYQVERRMIVFVVWILGVVIFLGVAPKDVPSRYLVYASPFMAVMLSCLLFEILPGRSKAFRRVPAMYFFVSIAVIMLSNIYAIHVRCYKTFLADYHSSYDLIKASYLIKDNLAVRRVDTRQTSIIVRNVTSIANINNFDPGDPFKYTFYAIAGVPKDLSINVPCRPGAECFDMKDFIRRPFAHRLLEELGWPKKDIAGKARNMFYLYGTVYNGDDKINAIDNILYQESLADRSAIEDIPPQAVRVEQYSGYDLYYLGGHYFAVKHGQPFYLSSFKSGSSGPLLVEKYKYRLRYLIDGHSHRMMAVQAMPPEKYTQLNTDKTVAYQVRWAGIPVGQLILDIKGRKTYEGEIILKPPGWIEKISSGKAVLVWRTFIDRDLILPLEAEYTTLYRQKKHQSSRWIHYHNDQNFLEGAGYNEDIDGLPNRDIVSLMLWLMLRQYAQGEKISTYFNYSKKFFQFDGDVRVDDDRVTIKGTVKNTDRTRSSLVRSIQIQLIKDGGVYEVEQIHLGGTMISIERR